MKLTFTPQDSFRWLAQGATVILAFGLGTQFCIHSVSPVLPAKPAPSAKKSLSDSLAPAPVVASPLPATTSFNSRQPISPSQSGPTQRLSLFIEAAAALNEPQTIAALRELDLKSGSFEAKLQRHVLLSHFAEIDPQTALTYVDTLSGGERDEQIANVLTTWASRDPQAAATHFQAISLNGGLASTEDRETAASIAGEWARRDPSAALDWAAGLPEEVRSEARGRVIASLAASNPAAAAQTASTLPQGYERAEAMKPLAAQWAQSSPENAATWVQTLPCAEQASAASGLISTWMNANPLAASQWVTNLSQGPARDAAIAAMVEAPTLRNDPEAAALWASSVNDPSLRSQLVAETATRWQRQNAAAATAWWQANAR